jgi:ATP-binding cassette subfamily B protein
MMLLRGLYPVDQVTLTIANETFSTLEPLSHYASLIPQDPEIFEQTIRYNITMGLDVDDATIMQMCDLARFSDVLATLPNGLDTDIKEKGVNLSGGQKQRLALARGLLMAADSRLLLLDESTSSVDVHNEKMIYEQIFATYSDKCIVASIHKLHLLPLFDYIYVIDK